MEWLADDVDDPEFAGEDWFAPVEILVETPYAEEDEEEEGDEGEEEE